MWITHKHVSPQSYPQLWSKYTGVISALPTRFHPFSGVIHIIYTQPVDNCGLWWVRRQNIAHALPATRSAATVRRRGAVAALQHTGGRSAGAAWSK